MPTLRGEDDGSGFGVKGSSPTGTGVFGDGPQWAGVVATSVTGSGVSAFSDTGAGVLSASNSGPAISGQSGHGVGVSGTSTDGGGVTGDSVSGVGVNGESRLDNGVLGTTQASARAGVFGRNASAGGGNGVTGLAEGRGGIGVFGSATVRGVGVVGAGATGVIGQGETGPGLRASSKQDHGVSGFAEREECAGVSGRSLLGPGVQGSSSRRKSPGLMGENAAGGTGVLGVTTGPGGGTPPIAGVHGQSRSDAPGIVGQSDAGAGVEAQGRTFGAYARSSAGTGVFAVGNPGMQALGGLVCLGNLAVLAPASGFIGAVSIAGDLKVAGGKKQFIIDHPLEPETRYLNHAAVEAPALKNLYDGIVALDSEGQARVLLPAWFAALNSELCYSLTPLGAPAPELHVAREFDGDGFTIGGGNPGQRVSWQVTGVRHDASAKAHPLVVETEKDAEDAGKYVDPAAFGRGPADYVTWVAEILERQTDAEGHAI